MSTLQVWLSEEQISRLVNNFTEEIIDKIESILCQATVHFTTGKFSSPSDEKTLQQKVGAAEAINFIAKELGIDLNEGLK